MNNAIIIYDNFPNSFGDQAYKEKIKQITKFYINPPQNFDILSSTDLNESLNLVCEKYEWVFINLLGHAVQSNNLYAEIIEFSKQNNYPLVGHIVFYPNNYPAIDSQFICINMEVYKKLKKPKFIFSNTGKSFESFNILRNDENFHDDYTPFWIKADTNSSTTYKAFHNFSLDFTKCYLENGHTIGNFNHEMRSKKFNLYALPNYIRNKKFFETKECDEPLPDIFKNILNEYTNLKNTVYVLNSENMNCNKKFRDPVNTYIGVAGGFKHIILLNHLNFTNQTNIIFTDISAVALDYQKYLIENWDGNLENYYNIYKNYEKKYPEYKYAWRSWNGWENEINLFLEQGKITKNDFYLLWQKYLKCKHDFINLDLLKDSKNLLAILEKRYDENIYIWFSNVYKMQWNVFFEDSKNIEESFSNFLLDLKKTKNRYIIDSHNFQTINC